jgi:glutamate dehydrogenase (NAD(P)+)
MVAYRQSEEPRGRRAWATRAGGGRSLTHRGARPGTSPPAWPPGQNAAVTIHKLGTTDAFVVLDLDDADHSVGPTRLAPKILVDGAELLARSATYLFASFGQQVGGASAGINARPDGRNDAVAAFVAELGPMVGKGTFTTEAARGLTAADLAPLAELAPRPLPTGETRSALLLAGIVAAADRALGGLDGRTVAVEGWEQAPAGLAAAFAERGASVVAVGTAKATVTAPGGFAADALSPGTTPEGDAGPADALWSADADVVLAGSKAGVVDHHVAVGVAGRAVVPWGPVPVTAKALASLRRRGVIVVPDFVALAGPSLASVGAVAADAPEAVAEAVGGVFDEVADHADGPLLAACYRAEAFLGTWRDALPFGRPLA